MQYIWLLDGKRSSKHAEYYYFFPYPILCGNNRIVNALKTNTMPEDFTALPKKVANNFPYLGAK